MRRIYEARAYGPDPLRTCYWPTTQPRAEFPALKGTQHTEVAVIGGGFTGLNAALRLAQDGVNVTLLDAEQPGWGASGRNGGFCCLGGGMLDTAQLDKTYGPDARKDWHQTELAAITYVADLLDRYQIDADTHSKGETLLAHRPKDWSALQSYAEQAAQNYGITPQLIPASDLAGHGLSGPFHGALTIPVGFALNPHKYAQGLAQAARTAGVRLYAQSPVTQIDKAADFTLSTPQGSVIAKRVIIATNGYSSEDIPHWLKSRFMPVQSSVLVTRPLSDAEIDAAGWRSDQMAFDTRNLLHYFRLMPNRRFLFGMRGGIFATRRADAKVMALVRQHFEQMFPAWAHVETPYQWSGLVCLNAKRMPYTGPVPDMPGAYTSLAYHGNGVAMASYCGTLLADLVQDKPTRHPYPEVLRRPPAKIPLGSKRRWLLPPIYTALGLADR